MDRNIIISVLLSDMPASPPARVAWIETYTLIPAICISTTVATREGGVDRNIKNYSAQVLKAVATREGGVDRNSLGLPIGEKLDRRHPRGWRG